MRVILRQQQFVLFCLALDAHVRPINCRNHIVYRDKAQATKVIRSEVKFSNIVTKKSEFILAKKKEFEVKVWWYFWRTRINIMSEA